jgi:hypothetical protein
MREILFRGKSLGNGKWIEGNLNLCTELGTAQILQDTRKYSGSFPVDPATICEFTGLYDKHGTRIWEGDILARIGDTDFVVTYCGDMEAGLGMDVGWYLQRDDFESWYPLESTLDLEVFGSIHDKKGN